MRELHTVKYFVQRSHTKLGDFREVMEIFPTELSWRGKTVPEGVGRVGTTRKSLGRVAMVKGGLSETGGVRTTFPKAPWLQQWGQFRGHDAPATHVIRQSQSGRNAAASE